MVHFRMQPNVKWIKNGWYDFYNDALQLWYDRGEENVGFANNVLLQSMNSCSKSRSKSSGKSSEVKVISGYINSQFHFSVGRIIGLTGSLLDQLSLVAKQDWNHSEVSR